MFKFNFGGEEDDHGESTNSMDCSGGSLVPSKEILVSEARVPTSAVDVVHFGPNREFSLKKYRLYTEKAQEHEHNKGNFEEASSKEHKNASDYQNASSSLQSILVKSDLEEGVYEGGFKLWECALDLTSFLSANRRNWEGKTVLELGCGHGLPGLWAYLHGASVHLQDFNEEVIKELTIPNVMLNGTLSSNIRFFSGDWASLSNVLGDEKYDVILTADTLYNPKTYSSLLFLFHKHLKPAGEILIAAKEYYFGVGGGIDEFLEHHSSHGPHPPFQVETLQTFATGTSNVRRLLRFTFKET